MWVSSSPPVARPLTAIGSLFDGEVSLTRQSSLVQANILGPMFLSLELGEQLAWLACISRKGRYLDQLTQVRARVLRVVVLEDRTTLNIDFVRIGVNSANFVQNNVAISDHCWLKLFRNCCIAEGVPIKARREVEQGLEIPFYLMAALGGFDRVADYAGQLVLKGFETLFVPIRKTEGSIIWHLITKPNRRRISYNAMYALSDQADRTVRIQDLFTSRHFLGWVSNAGQYAGKKNIPICFSFEC